MFTAQKHGIPKHCIHSVSVTAAAARRMKCSSVTEDFRKVSRAFRRLRCQLLMTSLQESRIILMTAVKSSEKHRVGTASFILNITAEHIRQSLRSSVITVKLNLLCVRRKLSPLWTSCSSTINMIPKLLTVCGSLCALTNSTILSPAPQ